MQSEPSPSVGELGQGHPPWGAAVRNGPEMANSLQIGQNRAQIVPIFAHSARNRLVGQQILPAGQPPCDSTVHRGLKR